MSEHLINWNLDSVPSDTHKTSFSNYNTQTITLNNLPLNIKAISMLLTRFGSQKNYDCIVEIYNTNDMGLPIGLPIGRSIKSASDINDTGFYNFIFEPIITNHNSKIVIVLTQTESDDNNFIFWHYENKTVEGWFSGDTLPSNENLYGYGYGYLYGAGAYSELDSDYFNLFSLESDNIGYSVSHYGTNLGYGFERTSINIDINKINCFKLYDSFNEITYEVDKSIIFLPNGITTNISVNNRQAFSEGYRRYVDVIGDKVLLRNVGKRISFYDLNINDKWHPTNENLPALVNDFSFIQNLDYLSPYKMIGVASCGDGLYLTLNSGGVWNILSSSLNKEYLLCDVNQSLTYGDETNKYIALGILLNDNTYELDFYNYTVTGNGFDHLIKYSFKDNADNDITSKPIALDVNWNDTTNTILIGTEDGFYFSNTTDLSTTFKFELLSGTSGYKINKILRLTFDTGILCTNNGLLEYTISTNNVSALNNSNNYGSINDCLIFKNRAYICTDNFILISKEETSTFNSSISWQGDDPSKSLYIIGIPKGKNNFITKTLDENQNDDTLFVCSENGVFYSKSGFDFKSLSNELYPDVDVKKLLVNKIDNQILHILSNSVLNKIPFITIAIDQSGSMYKRDGAANDQYKLAAETIKEIYQLNPSARFQIVLFSTKEVDSQLISSSYDRIGAVNLYNGFVPYSTALYDNIISLETNLHYRTPLYETLWAIFSGLHNGGSEWKYNKDNLKYNFEFSKDELLESSDNILMLFSDGNDTNSIKTLNDVINGFEDNIGSNQLNCKMYIIAYGENANVDKLKEIKTVDTELIYTRANNTLDYNTVFAYLSNKEKYRSRDGNYRKIFRFDNDIYVNKINVDCSLFQDTSLKYKYRISDNLYNLNDFTDYIEILDSGITSIIIEDTAKYIEIDFFLLSNNINNSPSINSITLEYIKPSKSNILFNIKTNPYDSKIHQVITTANIETYQKYGYGYDNETIDYDFFHLFNQNNISPKLKINSIFSNYDSINLNTYKEFPLDKKQYINYREMEKTTSINQTIYKAINGAWSSESEISIYSNGNIISSNFYYLSANKGEIIFLEPRKKSEDIRISISSSNSYRFGLKLYNFKDNNKLFLENFNYQFMAEETTKNTREALPIFSSQIPSSSSGITLASSNVLGNENNIIAGNLANIDSTILVKEFIPNGSKVTFGFGDFSENILTEEVLFTPHELNGLFSNLQYTDSTKENYVSITTSKPGVIFNSIKASEDYIGFTEATLNGVLDTDDRIFIKILNFDTRFRRPNPTRHILNSTDSDASFIPTAIVIGGIFTNFAVKINDDIFKETSPYIQFSSVNEADRIHISCPMTPSSNNIIASISIVDSNGIISTKTRAEIQLEVIELDSGAFTRTDLIQVLFEEEDNGNKKIPITLNSNYSRYYIIARFLSTRVVGSNVGSYFTYSNLIELNSNKKVLWGDLNIKSSLGNGRQSPNEIFEYAKTYSGLDFCVLSDSHSLLDQDKWDWQNSIANIYNIAGEFVTLHGIEWNDPNTSNIGYKTIVFGQQGYPTIDKINNKNIDSLLSNLISYNPIVFSQHPSYANNSIFNKFNVDYSTLKNKNNIFQLENGIEIYSEHGNSESFDLIDNAIINRASVTDSSFAVNAILNNFKPAFIANSNSQTSKPGLYAGELEITGRTLPPTDETNSSVNNRGITAVICSDFSRASIFDSIKTRHTYCTTGARITMEFNLNNFIMGDSVSVKEVVKSSGKTTDIPLVFSFKVLPTTERATLYLIKVDITNQNVSTVFTSNIGRSFETLTYDASNLIDGLNKKIAFYLRIVQSDRHMGWTSPIYIDYII